VARSSQPSFAIGVPARDEQSLIEASIESVLRSADALDDPSAMRLTVACDSCQDSTLDLARKWARRDGRVDVIEGTWRSAGACRAAAIGHALNELCERRPLRDIWVATTDADTVVPVDWLRSHGSFWSHGDHAVAGVVDVPADDIVRAVFTRHYTLGQDSHSHVHGANLGVRADAYLNVGGFPSVELAEDHALWHALRRAGYVCRSSVALRVTTSARLTGRAVGGFADDLRRLMTGPMRNVEATATA
jgi:cellulose synthase/poly-beta-1,6-N-acetylglucosamine synthase-like glycosyltransferase